MEEIGFSTKARVGSVILSRNGREIPAEALLYGSYVTSDPEAFLERVGSDSACNAYVNLADGFKVDPVSAPPRVHFYIASHRLSDLPDLPQQFHLKAQGGFLWLKEGDAYEDSVQLILLLESWRDSYVALERRSGVRDTEQQTRSSGTQSSPPTPSRSRLLLEKAKPFGRLVYPHLPRPMRNLALRVWGYLLRRTRS